MNLPRIRVADEAAAACDSEGSSGVGLALVRSKIEERKETIDKFSSSMLQEHCSDLHIGAPESPEGKLICGFRQVIADFVSSAFIAIDILGGKGCREVNNDIDCVRGGPDTAMAGRPGSSSGRSNVDPVCELPTASQRGRRREDRRLIDHRWHAPDISSLRAKCLHEVSRFVRRELG
jgi:hypothetical protein